MSLSAQFADFYLATREKPLSDINSLHADSTRYNTYLIREMLAGLMPNEYVQSGTKIIDHVMIDAVDNFREYLPTDNFTFAPTNVMTRIEVPWRFSLVDTNWTDHELELNEGDKETVFKKLARVKDAATMVSFWEGLEAQLWRTPDVAQMEDFTGTGRQPYSLRCFITDDGLAPSSTNGGVTGSNWTTVQTVNITNKPNFRNQVATYDTTSQTTVDNTLIQAFDRMWLDVQFRSPVNSQEYVKDTNIRKLKILASRYGLLLLQARLRAQNDRLVTDSNETNLGHYNGRLTFSGIPIDYIASLNDVDSVAEALAVPKPRFRWVNLNHMVPIFHQKNFQKLKKIEPSAGSPFTNLVIRDTWRNLLCRSRRQQGIVRGT